MPTSLEYEDNRAYGVIAECIQRVASGELSVIINKKFALCDAVKLIEERRAFGPVVLVPRFDARVAPRIATSYPHSATPGFAQLTP